MNGSRTASATLPSLSSVEFDEEVRCVPGVELPDGVRPRVALGIGGGSEQPVLRAEPGQQLPQGCPGRARGDGPAGCADLLAREVLPVLAMHDTVCHNRSDVSTVGFGGCFGVMRFVRGMGAKGKRDALPNTRVMLLYPSGQARGQASDIHSESRDLRHRRDFITALLARRPPEVPGAGSPGGTRGVETPPRELVWEDEALLVRRGVV